MESRAEPVTFEKPYLMHYRVTCLTIVTAIKRRKKYLN